MGHRACGRRHRGTGGERRGGRALNDRVEGVRLREALRLIVLTDHELCRPRALFDVVAEAVDAGARAVQLRDKDASAAELLDAARALLEITRPAGALLFVNDRLDVALAAGADGVHLGPDDLPVSAARLAAPSLLIGYSTDDPAVARRAEAHGADYIGCGAVFGTTSKEVGGEAIGLRALDRVARAVAIPVVGIGGVDPEGAAAVAADTTACGVAVLGAVMGAAEPGSVVRALRAPWEAREPAGGG